MAEQQQQASEQQQEDEQEKWFKERAKPKPQSKAEKVLGDLILRSSLQFDVDQLAFEKDAKEKAPRWDSHEAIVIAAISSSIAIHDADDEKSPPLDKADFTMRVHRDDCSLCEAAPNYNRSAWLEYRANELKAALTPPKSFGKPNIVCFGELAYPPPPAADFATGVEYVTHVGRRQAHFERRIRSVVDDHAGGAIPFLFLGSYHCPITLYNVGMVVPHGITDGQIDMHATKLRLNLTSTPEIEETTRKVSVPIPHRKRFPAKRASEQTRVPPDNRFRLFLTPVGRVAILICSDVVDMNQFLFIVRYNDSMAKVHRIDFVLVPSYNTSRALLEMCRQLSEMAATTVLVVNANHYDANNGFPHTSIFCCGKSFSSKQADDPGQVPELEFLQVKVKDLSHAETQDTSRITWFRFETKAFQNFVNQTADAMKAELNLSTNERPAPVS